MFHTRLVRLDPLQKIQFGAHYGHNTLAIRKPIHGIISRSIPVCSMKTRRRFRSKSVSFHVSVYYYIIINYHYLLFNFYLVWILFVHVIIVLDHAHLDDIYIRVVVFETGMYSIYC